MYIELPPKPLEIPWWESNRFATLSNDIFTSSKCPFGDVKFDLGQPKSFAFESTVEDSPNVFSSRALHPLLTGTQKFNTMNTSEDEPLSGLNARLRPRKSNVCSPQTKNTKKIDGKLATDRAKRISTLSKALPSKPDDLANKSDSLPAPQLLCPYCDRKFTSKQTVSKHVRRTHFSTSKQDLFIPCLFCTHTEAAANDIIRHMVNNHQNQYFACLDCHTRFSSTIELDDHKLNLCEKHKPYRSKLRPKNSAGDKKGSKKCATDRKEHFDADKDYSDGHSFNGVVISCELKPSQVHDEADIEDNITTNLILPPSKSLGNNTVIEKNAVIVLDDIQWNKRIPQNFSFHNTDADQILSRLGVVHRSPRTGESTRRDFFKTTEDATQKFEKCFDTSFYSKVASNVQENLAKCLDGSFNFNPGLDNTIKTRKSKNSVVINTAEGFPILLAFEQYSRNVFDSYLPRGIAPKHKWKWDSLENDKSVMNPDQIKRDCHANNCIITLVSSLDIWTQLCMRRKYEQKFHISHIEKKTEKQNMIDKELKDILESREIPTTSSQVMKYTGKPLMARNSAEFPLFLGLTPSSPAFDLQPAVLSGEWVRPRCYVCCACGAQSRDSRALSSHMSMQHPNAQVQHYEIVGEPLLNADILKHLYVPPSPVTNRTRPLRGIRDCTKCKKSVTLEELHQHMLDCAGDTPAVRRKCRYRPFGVRKRRPRLPDNMLRRKMRKDLRNRHKQKAVMRPRPKIRTEVGDAETIRKMIADLPAKRHRVMINPMNPSLRPRKQHDQQRNKLMIKRHSSEVPKSRRLRTIKASNTNCAMDTTSNKDEKSTVPNKDDDDVPLLPKKRITEKNKRQSENVKRKTVVNRPKRKIKMKNNTPKLPAPDNISENGNLENTDLAGNNQNPDKININNGQNNNARQNSGRAGNNNRGNERIHGRDNGGGGNARQNNINNNDNTGPGQNAPAPNAPLKHSIASLTADIETRNKSLQLHQFFLMQQECKTATANRHAPSEQKQLFEKEEVERRLDKPPLTSKQKLSIDPTTLQKNKMISNKTRKGLNDCIAMLKNKLVDPVFDPSTGHLTCQYEDDDALEPDLTPNMEDPIHANNKNDPKPSEVFSRPAIPDIVESYTKNNLPRPTSRRSTDQTMAFNPESPMFPSKSGAGTVRHKKFDNKGKQNNVPVKRKSTRLTNQRQCKQQKIIGLPSQNELITRESEKNKNTQSQYSSIVVDTAGEIHKYNQTANVQTDLLPIKQAAPNDSKSPRTIDNKGIRKYDMSGGRIIDQKTFTHGAMVHHPSLINQRPLQRFFDVSQMDPKFLSGQLAFNDHMARMKQGILAEKRSLPDERVLPPDFRSFSEASDHLGLRPLTEQIALAEQKSFMERRLQEARSYSEQIPYQGLRSFPKQLPYPEPRILSDHRFYQEQIPLLEHMPFPEHIALDRLAYAEQRRLVEQQAFLQSRLYQDPKNYTEPIYPERREFDDQSSNSSLARKKRLEQSSPMEQKPQNKPRSSKDQKSLSDRQFSTEQLQQHIDQRIAKGSRSKDSQDSNDFRSSFDSSPYELRSSQERRHSNELRQEGRQSLREQERWPLQNQRISFEQMPSFELRPLQEGRQSHHLKSMQERRQSQDHKPFVAPRQLHIQTHDPRISQEHRGALEQKSPREQRALLEQRSPRDQRPQNEQWAHQDLRAQQELHMQQGIRAQQEFLVQHELRAKQELLLQQGLRVHQELHAHQRVHQELRSQHEMQVLHEARIFKEQMALYERQALNEQRSPIQDQVQRDHKSSYDRKDLQQPAHETRPLEEHIIQKDQRTPQDHKTSNEPVCFDHRVNQERMVQHDEKLAHERIQEQQHKPRPQEEQLFQESQRTPNDQKLSQKPVYEHKHKEEENIARERVQERIHDQTDEPRPLKEQLVQKDNCSAHNQKVSQEPVLVGYRANHGHMVQYEEKIAHELVQEKMQEQAHELRRLEEEQLVQKNQRTLLDPKISQIPVLVDHQANQVNKVQQEENLARERVLEQMHDQTHEPRPLEKQLLPKDQKTLHDQKIFLKPVIVDHGKNQEHNVKQDLVQKQLHEQEAQLIQATIEPKTLIHNEPQDLDKLRDSDDQRVQKDDRNLEVCEPRLALDIPTMEQKTTQESVSQEQNLIFEHNNEHIEIAEREVTIQHNPRLQDNQIDPNDRAFTSDDYSQHDSRRHIQNSTNVKCSINEKLLKDQNSSKNVVTSNQCQLLRDTNSSDEQIPPKEQGQVCGNSKQETSEQVSLNDQKSCNDVNSELPLIHPRSSVYSLEDKAPEGHNLEDQKKSISDELALIVKKKYELEQSPESITERQTPTLEPTNQLSDKSLSLTVDRDTITEATLLKIPSNISLENDIKDVLPAHTKNSSVEIPTDIPAPLDLSGIRRQNDSESIVRPKPAKPINQIIKQIKDRIKLIDIRIKNACQNNAAELAERANLIQQCLMLESREKRELTKTYHLQKRPSHEAEILYPSPFSIGFPDEQETKDICDSVDLTEDDETAMAELSNTDKDKNDILLDVKSNLSDIESSSNENTDENIVQKSYPTYENNGPSILENSCDLMSNEPLRVATSLTSVTISEETEVPDTVVTPPTNTESSFSNTLFNIANTVLANTSALDTLAGTNAEKQKEYVGETSVGDDGNSSPENVNHAIFKEANIVEQEVAPVTAVVDIEQDPETARQIAMLPKELVEILGTMPADHRKQLLNVLPQYVSTSTAVINSQSRNDIDYLSYSESSTSPRRRSSDSQVPSPGNMYGYSEHQSMPAINSYTPNYGLPSNMPEGHAQYMDSSHPGPFLLGPPQPPPSLLQHAQLLAAPPPHSLPPHQIVTLSLQQPPLALHQSQTHPQQIHLATQQLPAPLLSPSKEISTVPQRPPLLPNYLPPQLSLKHHLASPPPSLPPPVSPLLKESTVLQQQQPSPKTHEKLYRLTQHLFKMNQLLKIRQQKQLDQSPQQPEQPPQQLSQQLPEHPKQKSPQQPPQQPPQHPPLPPLPLQPPLPKTTPPPYLPEEDVKPIISTKEEESEEIINNKADDNPETFEISKKHFESTPLHINLHNKIVGVDTEDNAPTYSQKLVNLCENLTRPAAVISHDISNCTVTSKSTNKNKIVNDKTASLRAVRIKTSSQRNKSLSAETQMGPKIETSSVPALEEQILHKMNSEVHNETKTQVFSKSNEQESHTLKPLTALVSQEVTKTTVGTENQFVIKTAGDTDTSINATAELVKMSIEDMKTLGIYSNVQQAEISSTQYANKQNVVPPAFSQSSIAGNSFDSSQVKKLTPIVENISEKAGITGLNLGAVTPSIAMNNLDSKKLSNNHSSETFCTNTHVTVDNSTSLSEIHEGLNPLNEIKSEPTNLILKTYITEQKSNTDAANNNIMTVPLKHQEQPLEDDSEDDISLAAIVKQKQREQLQSQPCNHKIAESVSPQITNIINSVNSDKAKTAVKDIIETDKKDTIVKSKSITPINQSIDAIDKVPCGINVSVKVYDKVPINHGKINDKQMTTVLGVKRNNEQVQDFHNINERNELSKRVPTKVCDQYIEKGLNINHLDLTKSKQELRRNENIITNENSDWIELTTNETKDNSSVDDELNKSKNNEQCVNDVVTITTCLNVSKLEKCGETKNNELNARTSEIKGITSNPQNSVIVQPENMDNVLKNSNNSKQLGNTAMTGEKEYKKLPTIQESKNLSDYTSPNEFQECIDMDDSQVTPLRRCGKSIVVDTIPSEPENTVPVPEVVIESKIPLTKKQLIFSKLLLDVENNTNLAPCLTFEKQPSLAQNLITADTDTVSYIRSEVKDANVEDCEKGDLGKNKKNKRKKSPMVKKKYKKKKSYDNSQTVDDETDTENSQICVKDATDNLSSEISFITEVPMPKNADNTNLKLSYKDSNVENILPIPSASTSAVTVDIKSNKDCVKNVNVQNDCAVKLNTSAEKRKLSAPSPHDVCGQNIKPKKSKPNTKFDNYVKYKHCKADETDELISSKKNKSHLHSERITCYMPAASRRTRSKSVFVKSSSTDFYDPYDIDCDDMIEKTEAVGRKKKIQGKHQNSLIQKNTKIPNDETVLLNDLEMSDSNDSSKSDVPLKKLFEGKVKKISSKLISDTKNKLQEKPNNKEPKKGKRNLVPLDTVEKSVASNVTDPPSRSDRFLESFGFFAERQPRKSNLLASKKISETFHVIDKEDKYLYRQRPTKRSLQNNSRKFESGPSRGHHRVPKRSIKRGRVNKKKTFIKPLPCFCGICKKKFRRPDNYLRHQMTLLHISKLSEVEMKMKTTAIHEEPNYLIVYKQQLDRLKILSKKFARKRKKNPKSKIKFKLPTLDEILVEVNKTVREQQLTQRGLSRDEALFIDCCQLLKSNKNDVPTAESAAISNINKFSCATESTVKDYDLLEKPNKGDGDVDSITAKNILESEEVRNLENDLISGLKEAANASTLKAKVPYQRSVSDVELNRSEDPNITETSYASTSKFESGQELISVKTKKHSEHKEKMYPDIIEPIDMFEDKFDKIKRKCRSQAAAAKQMQVVIEPKISQKGRKKSEKKKGKKNSRKNNQSAQIPTKGALKGFDGIKVSIPTTDINMSAIAPAMETTKKKKKSSSKKKRGKREFESSSKYESQSRPKGGSSPLKKVDVYEFMDNEDAELFEFRPSTLMERFKSISNKETASTSKFNPVVDDSYESVSDGDDFVYMSDDYVCSDDETDNSLLSCELSTIKVSSDSKKNISPFKRKDAIEKNAVMGKIFKHNAVRSERKSTKVKETAKPKANLDQLFDSLLEDEPNSSIMKNHSTSSEKEDFRTKKHEQSSKSDKYNRTHSSKDELSSSIKFCTSSPKRYCSQSPKQCKSPIPIDYGPSTSKKYDKFTSAEYGTKKRDMSLPKEYRDLSPKKYDFTSKRLDANISKIYTSAKHTDTLSAKAENMLYKARESKSKSSKDKSFSLKLDEGIGSDFNTDFYDHADYDDMGVARQRARRKCTVGKQNVLAETWSSESEPDGLPPRPNSAESVVMSCARRKKGKKKDGARRGNSRHVTFRKQEVETRLKKNPSSNGGSRRDIDSDDGISCDVNPYDAPVPSTSQASLAPPAPRSRPRTSSYYWSSEGDEEPEHVQQHGWIVGDSHKKLVTMLAHAKGRKRNDDKKNSFVD